MAEPKSHLSPPAYGSVDEVPRDIYQRALGKKLPWIQRFLNEGCPRGKLVMYATAYADASGLGEEAVPAYSTLNTWVHRYLSYGLLGLMDSVRVDAGKRRALDPDVAETAKILRIGGKKGVAESITELARLFPDEKMPMYHTLRRHVRQFERDNPHLIAVADDGVAGYRSLYRLALAGDTHPGGAVYAMDSTVADIWVRIKDASASTGWTAVRVVFTVLEDVGSRLLITFNFAFAQIDSGILKGVFRRAVIQGSNYPGLWSPGLPRRIILDRGSENQGAFRKMLDLYNVEVMSGPPNTPEHNGRNERVIQTVQHEVFAGMRGYSRVQEPFYAYAPAEWDAKRRLSQLKYEPYRLELPVEMLPTITELETEVLAWAHLYNARSHVGLPVDEPELMSVLAQAARFDGEYLDEQGDDDA